MEYEFKSLKELYNRIKPALISKKCELDKMGYSIIQESDIWNYLTQNKWMMSHSLTLYEMVSDIFNVTGEEVNNYLIKKVSEEMRLPNFEK